MENVAIKVISDCIKEHTALPMYTFNVLLWGDNPKRQSKIPQNRQSEQSISYLHLLLHL